MVKTPLVKSFQPRSFLSATQTAKFQIGSSRSADPAECNPNFGAPSCELCRIFHGAHRHRFRRSRRRDDYDANQHE